MSSANTILLVEDEAMIRFCMVDMLEREGLTVCEAQSGVEAIRLLEDGSPAPAVLITDIRLGDGPNGWDVARHARQAIGDIPIIFVSGDSVQDWEARGVAGSVMLSKPVADRDLISAVLNALPAGSAETA